MLKFYSKLLSLIISDEALEDYKRVLELDPNNTESKRAVNILPQKVSKNYTKIKFLGRVYVLRKNLGRVESE